MMRGFTSWRIESLRYIDLSPIEIYSHGDTHTPKCTSYDEEICYPARAYATNLQRWLDDPRTKLIEFERRTEKLPLYTTGWDHAITSRPPVTEEVKTGVGYNDYLVTLYIDIPEAKMRGYKRTGMFSWNDAFEWRDTERMDRIAQLYEEIIIQCGLGKPDERSSSCSGCLGITSLGEHHSPGS